MSTATATARSRQATAAAVSRTLAAADLRPLPSSSPAAREGIRVRSHRVATVVELDYDTAREAQAVRAAAEAALLAAGYVVVDAPLPEGSWHCALHVTRPKP